MTRSSTRRLLRGVAWLIRDEAGAKGKLSTWPAIEGFSLHRSRVFAPRDCSRGIFTSLHCHRASARSDRPPLPQLMHHARFLRSTVAPLDKVEVPAMGESISEGGIAAVMVKEGDIINDGDVVAQVETDKVTIDVPYTGPPAKVTQVYVSVGDSVTVGQGVCEITTEGVEAAPAGKATKEAPAESAEPPKPAAAPAATPAESSRPAPAPAPAPPTVPGGGESAEGAGGAAAGGERVERRVKITRLRMRVAERLKGAQNTYAMLTTFNEVDMTNLMELRSKHKDAFLEKHGVKLGFMSAFIAAASDALRLVPAVNGVIDGEDIVYRDYTDISVAVATPKGLVVPVIRNVERMNFADIERALGDMGRKARDGTISIDDMAGGTFTVSNGGVFGSMLSTPIINPPQSAILGMHSIQQRPMVVGGAIVPRPMMFLALTYDHRLVDGREAVTFLRRIKEVIEDPARLLLDV